MKHILKAVPFDAFMLFIVWQTAHGDTAAYWALIALLTLSVVAASVYGFAVYLTKSLGEFSDMEHMAKPHMLKLGAIIREHVIHKGTLWKSYDTFTDVLFVFVLYLWVGSAIMAGVYFATMLVKVYLENFVTRAEQCQ